MSEALPSQNWKWTPYLALGGAILLAVLLFLLIPLTQMLHSPEKPDVVVREIQISAPPPPKSPPLPEETPPPEPIEQIPDIPQDPPPIDLQLLDIQLSPGTGDAVAMGTPMPTLQSSDYVQDIKELFSFDDLSEVPRLLHAPSFRFPSDLVRRGISKGKVVVEIDILTNGSAQLHRIVSSTNRELEPVARDIIARARFTKPMVDGQPQRVRGRFPLILEN